jgi:preprotein translocase subunit SecG
VDLRVALNIVQLIISIVLIAVVLMQAKGSSIGSLFGGSESSIYRTRRGLEKRLFQFTIVLAVIFVLLSILSSVFGSAPVPVTGPTSP